MTHALTATDLRDLRVSVHEAGHAVAAVLYGGTIDRIDLAEGATHYGAVPDQFDHEVTFAGPWAEARWLAGHRPSGAQIAGSLARNSHDAEALTASGHVDRREVSALLELVWPAVEELAATLYVRGHAGHRDVLDALQLSGDHYHSFDLHQITSARMWPVRVLRPVE
ncbi:M50 family metallopeptidase [Rhodococcus sp. BP-332]|uniref:M50 family metallopeptidase n=1 Tax=Rhodococcus sp. BP-332 TaxID=2739447 RepID=UPI001C9B1208|nr:M50 family metallopeptidase [Rhodococcus sp. BP-332]MBY6675323.1 M50 family metallopeptidase [Rhodococcus sp. BP-332]